MREGWRLQLFLGIHTNVQLFTVIIADILVNGQILWMQRVLIMQVACCYLWLHLQIFLWVVLRDVTDSESDTFSKIRNPSDT